MKLDYSNHPYGRLWYRHYDGRPHPDDDNSYAWNKILREWQRDWEYDEFHSGDYFTQKDIEF